MSSNNQNQQTIYGKTESQWFEELKDLLTEYDINPSDLRLGEDADEIPEIEDDRDDYDDFSDELPNFHSELCGGPDEDRLRTEWIPKWFTRLQSEYFQNSLP